jgi:hypothetical protein
VQVDHEDVGFALVYLHQGRTTVPTSVLHGRSSPVQQRRCAGDCGNGQWWWDDLEGLLKHPAFLENSSKLLNLIAANQRIFLR